MLNGQRNMSNYRLKRLDLTWCFRQGYSRDQFFVVKAFFAVFSFKSNQHEANFG